MVLFGCLLCWTLVSGCCDNTISISIHATNLTISQIAFWQGYRQCTTLQCQQKHIAPFASWPINNNDGHLVQVSPNNRSHIHKHNTLHKTDCGYGAYLREWNKTPTSRVHSRYYYVHYNSWYCTNQWYSNTIPHNHGIPCATFKRFASTESLYWSSYT